MNSGVKIACAVLLVAIVTAAGVGLLVQHRKLDELRRAHADLDVSKQILVADHAELVSANEKLAGELRMLRDAVRARATERAAVDKERESLEKERTAWEQERERLKADAAAAQAAVLKRYYAVAGAFKEASGAQIFVDKLKENGFPVRTFDFKSGLTVVCVEGSDSLEVVRRDMAALKKLGIAPSDPWVYNTNQKLHKEI